MKVPEFITAPKLGGVMIQRAYTSRKGKISKIDIDMQSKIKNKGRKRPTHSKKGVIKKE
jgi:hypothetical protein